MLISVSRKNEDGRAGADLDHCFLPHLKFLRFSACPRSWSAPKTSVSNRTSRAVDFLEHARNKIPTTIKERTCFTVGMPDRSNHGGNSTTGNAVRSHLFTENRKLLTLHIVSDIMFTTINEIIFNVAIIFKVVNYNKIAIIELYNRLCSDTEVLTKNSSRW